jgi:3-methylfumaryl-CoA hydratase
MTGRAEQADDLVTRRQIDLLAALLDHSAPRWPADELPPLGHWLLFPPTTHQSGLGRDGHPVRADGLPRRMWAGSRIRFHAPLTVGMTLSRETTCVASVEKTGRSGPMRFDTLAHRIFAGGRIVIEEEQDLVYRRMPPPGSPSRAPAPEHIEPVPVGTPRMSIDPVQLFRFSALTHNAHRIHYDRDYARDVEGYPGLVVHGPYLATLLMDAHLGRHGPPRVTGFEFRALRPVFDGEPFALCSRPEPDGATFGIVDRDGGLAMRARLATD